MGVYQHIFNHLYFLRKKKNIEFGLIDMCIVLTVFYCNFRKILHKCNLQCLFFQYGVHCFCGNEIKTSSNCVPDGECNMFCQGNRDELCGGHWKIYIFRNEQTMHLCKHGDWRIYNFTHEQTMHLCKMQFQFNF